MLQRLEIEFFEVDIKEVGDELFSAIVVVPLLADRVDVVGVHDDFPFLEDVNQFKFGVLLVAQGSV